MALWPWYSVFPHKFLYNGLASEYPRIASEEEDLLQKSLFYNKTLLMFRVPQFLFIAASDIYCKMYRALKKLSEHSFSFVVFVSSPSFKKLSEEYIAMPILSFQEFCEVS